MHTPLHMHMITMYHPPPKHHPSQRPGIPLFQRSVLPSHPLTTPRPPTIVYPHRASSTTPLASASTPPHEPYLFLAADVPPAPLTPSRTEASRRSNIDRISHLAQCVEACS